MGRICQCPWAFSNFSKLDHARWLIELNYKSEQLPISNLIYWAMDYISGLFSTRSNIALLWAILVGYWTMGSIEFFLVYLKS